MTPKTEEYLRANGVGEDVLAELRAGRPVSITAEGLRSWMAGAFHEGQQSAAQLLQQAELALMEADDRAFQIGRRLERLSKIEAEHVSFQSLVADCQCWFDGFLASFVGKDSWEKPWTPDTGRLRALNDAFRHVAPPSGADAEIPF
jgi:hypothetical protein